MRRWRVVGTRLGESVWGMDEDHLPEVALAALARAGAATVASWEADTNGALLAALAGAEPLRTARRRMSAARSTPAGSPARRWPMR